MAVPSCLRLRGVDAWSLNGAIETPHDASILRCGTQTWNVCSRGRGDSSKSLRTFSLSRMVSRIESQSVRNALVHGGGSAIDSTRGWKSGFEFGHLRRNGGMYGSFPLGNTDGSRRSRVSMALNLALSDQAVWGILVSCAALSQGLEENTKIGSQISAPLLSLLFAMVFSSIGILPIASKAYDQIWTTVVPLAIAFSLLETNIKQAFSECGPTLTAYFVSAVGTIVGTVLSFFLVGKYLGTDGWKIASCFCSTYIGGSVNYVATAQALGLGSGSLLIGGMAADNFLMAIYFTVIMAIPERWRHEKNAHNPTHKDEGNRMDDPLYSSKYPRYYSSESDEEHDVTENKKGKNITIINLLCCCSAGFFSIYIGDVLIQFLPTYFRGSNLAFTAVIASLLSGLMSLFNKRKETASSRVQLFHGSETLGSALMLVFFSTLGATANFHEAFSKSFNLFIFGGILLSIHLIFSLLVGRIMNLPLQSILIASNANVGGPATASAMATARSWKNLVRPALLVGTFGYMIGTGAGCFLGLNILKPMAIL